MHKICFVFATLLSVSTLAWGGKPGPSTCPPNSGVTVTVYDYDTTGTLLLERSDDFNGTNQAQYNESSNASLTTLISCGMLRFNLYGQSSTTQVIRTMYITVTSNSVSNNQCVSWTLTPNMAPSSTNPPMVANLYYYAKGGKLTFIGQYYMTFRIDAS